jgi:hypothetical protein
MAVCAASSISDKVAVGITNNPIHFHRLAPEGEMKSENKNVKNEWTTKQRNGSVMSLVCSGCDVDTLLSVMSVGSQSCVLFSSSVSYLVYVTLHIETTGHPIFRVSFIHIGDSIQVKACDNCTKERLLFPVTNLHLLHLQLTLPTEFYLYFNISFLCDLHPYLYKLGAGGGVVVKALRYKPAGRRFDSRWCHWIFSVT